MIPRSSARSEPTNGHLAVWAPRAAKVEVLLGGERIAMDRQASGWHRVGDLRIAPGVLYAFSLDGGPATPDPRSLSQPDGPHGPSQRVDAGTFRWTDTGFEPPRLGLVYELHVGTFSAEGTLDGAIPHLDHLVRLGASHVELMPIVEFPGTRGWGYDGVDLYAVHHAYGGPEALVRFVDASHARGLGVILDVVYNHLGPDGNYLARFGPYFTDRYHTRWGEAVNLDGRGSDEVRRFLVDNALSWLRDFHVDGLRIDAIHALFDESAVHFLEQLAGEVRSFEHRTGRRVTLIAESDLNDPRVLLPAERGGHGLDAQWSDDLHHALHAWLSGERAGYYTDFGAPEQVADALENAFVFRGQHSAFRGRRHGRAPTGIAADRFVSYLQSHDQIGNRAEGDRFAHFADPAGQRVAATILLTSPFVPMLFQGEEWDASSPFLYFTDHEDPALGTAVSEGRRREFTQFGWAPESIPDPQAESTFARSRLRWDELEREPHRRMLALYEGLLALRRARPDLRDPRLETVHARVDAASGALIVERAETVIVAHASAKEVRVLVDASQLLLASEAGAQLTNGALVLPPRAAAVLHRGAKQ